VCIPSSPAGRSLVGPASPHRHPRSQPLPCGPASSSPTSGSSLNRSQVRPSQPPPAPHSGPGTARRGRPLGLYSRCHLAALGFSPYLHIPALPPPLPPNPSARPSPLRWHEADPEHLREVRKPSVPLFHVLMPSTVSKKSSELQPRHRPPR
jgi:hypothetical protein